MIASSVLNSITFKNLTGIYPNTWNTLHNSRIQGQNKIIPYFQKFQKDHMVYLQFISDDTALTTLTSYCNNVQIETITNSYSSHYGTTDNRYFTNFVIVLDSAYYDKIINFKAVQGLNTLFSEPIRVIDLTSDISKGIIKYIKYTNIDRIESDLDDRFIDWSIVDNNGNFMDLFIDAQDFELNDTDENEVLEGSQSMTILSSVYYAGRVLKTSGIPDFMVAKLGIISSLDVFMVNDIQYIKKGEIEKNNYGGSTLYQASIKMIQKNAIGINVDNLEMKGNQGIIYIGSVTNTNPTESNIKTMKLVLSYSSDQSFTYTIDSKRYCIAYPANWSDITSVKDPSGYEIVSGFVKTNISLTVNGSLVDYTVQTFYRLVGVTNYKLTYIF